MHRLIQTRRPLVRAPLPSGRDVRRAFPPRLRLISCFSTKGWRWHRRCAGSARKDADRGAGTGGS